jgi:hypothetical protein
LLVAGQVVVAAWESEQYTNGDAELYLPKEDDFRSAFYRDEKNQKRQSWKEYWGWIESYYQGNLLDAGWTKHSGALVEKVRGEQAQRQLRRELNLLGRLIAAEWAKDNGARKIDTAALRSWSKRLLKAKNEDDGSGRTITMEIDTIRREAETFLTK